MRAKRGRGRHSATWASSAYDETNRRRIELGVGVTAVLGLVVAGMSMTAGTAAADGPEKLLQVVQVGLGSDGTIDSVKRSDIAQDKDGYHSSNADLDPSAVASQMPISVSTLYSVKGGSGTDLADLKGVNGDVKVSFTVNNLTVAPQTFSYNGGTTTALVGAPFTVVATAVIPKDSVSSIQTAKQVAGQGVNAGSVATLPNGDYQVQWATILAPPALPQSSTFTLSENAHGFKLKSFSLTATPGETTDPGLQQMIQTTFGSHTALTDVEDATVQQLKDAARNLDRVGGQLHHLGRYLKGQSGGLGAQISSEVGTEKTQISTQLGSLRDQLTSLSTSLGSAIVTDTGEAGDDITGSVATINQKLGIGAGLSDADRASSVLGKIDDLKNQLDRSASLTGAALTAANARLGTALDAAYGQIHAMRTALVGLADGLFGTIQQGLSTQDRALNLMRVELANVGSLIGGADCGSAALAKPEDVLESHGVSVPDACSPQPGNTAEDVTSALKHILYGTEETPDTPGLVALVGSLASALGVDGVAGSIGSAGQDGGSASSAASGLADSIESASGDASDLQDKADAVGAAICAPTPTDSPSNAAEQSMAAHVDAIASAAGVDCDNGQLADTQSGGLSQLARRNAASIDSLSQAVGGLQGSLSSIVQKLNLSNTQDGSLGELVGKVKAIVGHQDDKAAGTLQGDLYRLGMSETKQENLETAVDSLIADLGRLGDTTDLAALNDGSSASCASSAPSSIASAPPSPTAGVADDDAPLSSLASLFEYSCGLEGLLWGQSADSLSEFTSSAAASETSISAGVQSAGGDATSALADAATGVPAEISAGASAMSANASRAISSAGAEMSRDANTTSARIKAQGKDVQHTLATTVSGFNKVQKAQEAKLVAALAAVQRQLGTPGSGGNGLLGNLYLSGGQVQGQSNAVDLTKLDQADHASVRSAQLLGAQLQAQQLTQGLIKMQALAPIGETLATEDSSSSTGFVFAIGKIG